MEIYDGIIEKKGLFPDGSCVALGFFDGVHIAHRKLIGACVEYAQSRGLKPVVHTFYSMPKGEAIEDFERRAYRISLLGAATAADRFDSEYMSMSPREFFDRVVIGSLCARAVFVGKNHTFGSGGSGGIAELSALCRESGTELFVIDDVEVDGAKVSSSRIKEAVVHGDMELASRLLGRPFEISGEVRHGRGVGHAEVVPTANLAVRKDLVTPKPGVYLCRAEIDGKEYTAIGNLGVHPTFEMADEPVFEPYFLDFSGDIYGKMLNVKLIKYMRGEKKFPSPAELREQLRKDEEQARTYVF